jgi:hypothetical protein
MLGSCLAAYGVKRHIVKQIQGEMESKDERASRTYRRYTQGTTAKNC